MGLVSLVADLFCSSANKMNRLRYSEAHPEKSENTVCTIQTCYLMDEYLSKLENTPIKSLADIVKYNDENRGSEGGHPYDIPAFPDGQPLFRECVATKGIKTPAYHAALKHTQSQCREHGIDAALASHGEELDALLFCDIKRGGIQIAAQAGYPVLTIPVGLDPDGMPVPLMLIHSAWQDDKLVKWASAIEDLLVHKQALLVRMNGDKQLERSQRLGRIPPTYIDHLRKNIPVERSYRYPGAKNETPEPWPERPADPDLSKDWQDADEGRA